MAKILITIGIVILAVIIGVVFMIGSQSRRSSSSSSVESEKPSDNKESVDASEATTEKKEINWVRYGVAIVYNNYKENELKTDEALKDKLFELEGYVESVGVDALNKPFIIMVSNIEEKYGPRVQAYVGSNCKSEASDLQAGQKILIRCSGKGKFVHPLVDVREIGEMVRDQVFWKCN